MKCLLQSISLARASCSFVVVDYEKMDFSFYFDSKGMEEPLSGHIHEGQVRIPFIGALVAPDQGLFPDYGKGIFQLHSERYLYVDSGLGTSNAPIRFLNQSQLSLIKIVNNDRCKIYL